MGRSVCTKCARWTTHSRACSGSWSDDRADDQRRFEIAIAIAVPGDRDLHVAVVHPAEAMARNPVAVWWGAAVRTAGTRRRQLPNARASVRLRRRRRDLL